MVNFNFVYKVVEFVYIASKYVIPVILIVTMSAKILSSYDIGAWHFVPGVEFIGSLSSGIGMIVILGCLLGFGIFISKYFNQGKIFSSRKLKEKK